MRYVTYRNNNIFIKKHDVVFALFDEDVIDDVLPPSEMQRHMYIESDSGGGIGFYYCDLKDCENCIHFSDNVCEMAMLFDKRLPVLRDDKRFCRFVNLKVKE